jgi:hypothetical protein
MLFRYARILERCEPYLIATDEIASQLNPSPLGVTIPVDNRINPQHRRHADFLALLRFVDSLTFGPYGMQMPDWVFYDCAVMPGAVFGLGVRRTALEPWALDALRVPPKYDGLIPLSVFIAIPMLPGHRTRAPGEPPPSWLLYTLDEMNQVSPGMGPEGMLSLTFALGLRVFPIRTLYGMTQWRAPKLDLYVDLGPLELLSAYTPAHSLPRTLSFRTPINELHLSTLLMGTRMHPLSPPPNVLIDVDDVEQLKQVQREIEEGWRYSLVFEPETRGTYVQAPLLRLPPEVRS